MGTGGVQARAWRNWYRNALPSYWIFLACVTHFPRLQLPGPPQSDKASHFLAFGLLAFLFWRFAESFRGRLSDAFVWKAAVLLIAYASLDEWTQQFVGRGTTWEDWIANLSGIGFVLTVLELWRRRGAPAAAGPRAGTGPV